MKALPFFPQIRPLVFEDKPLLDKVFKKYPPQLSEFTFTNLFAWRYAYRFHVAQMDNFILVVSVKDGTFEIFDPLGPMAAKESVMRECFSVCPSDTHLKFVRLSRETADLFDQEKELQVQEDADNFDYVYLTQDLIDLKGKDFDGKRNFIKRFRQEYKYTYKHLTPEDVKECLSFKEEWCLAKDCLHTEGLAKEIEATSEMLENFQYLGIKGGMIEVGGKIEALTLGEVLNSDVFVVHVEKANGSLLGIYQTINQEFCAHEAQSYRYVNREQDLGVLGLRQAKESYHPHHRVKKYSLEYSL